MMQWGCRVGVGGGVGGRFVRQIEEFFTTATIDSTSLSGRLQVLPGRGLNGATDRLTDRQTDVYSSCAKTQRWWRGWGLEKPAEVAVLRCGPGGGC